MTLDRKILDNLPSHSIIPDTAQLKKRLHTSQNPKVVNLDQNPGLVLLNISLSLTQGLISALKQRLGTCLPLTVALSIATDPVNIRANLARV